MPWAERRRVGSKVSRQRRVSQRLEDIEAQYRLPMPLLWLSNISVSKWVSVLVIGWGVSVEVGLSDGAV